MIHFALFKFYGIDWMAMILMFSLIYALGLQKRVGFIFGAGGCLFWILFGVMTGSIADIAANCICFGMNIFGYRRWVRNGS